MEELDLFDCPAYARRSDPETSRAAAESVDGAEANRMEKIVFDAIEASKMIGLTGVQITAITGLTYQSATPRLKPLVKKGLIYDSGERRVGPSGRKSIVWKTWRYQ